MIEIRKILQPQLGGQASSQNSNTTSLLKKKNRISRREQECGQIILAQFSFRIRTAFVVGFQSKSESSKKRKKSIADELN